MTEEVIAEHNRVFQEAMAIIKGQIPLNGQADMSVPSWLLGRKLKHALVLFERVLQINPENWSAMWFIGKVHQRLRNKTEALSWFERSYQVNPSSQTWPEKLHLCDGYWPQ
jgi:tetratricopeptide (TPR) repeat protein